jgi:hypothetical protein
VMNELGDQSPACVIQITGCRVAAVAAAAGDVTVDSAPAAILAAG